jgi:hypothetical protein
MSGAFTGAVGGTRRFDFECTKGKTMSDPSTTSDLETQIADVRDNIRELTEQAAAYSGAADEGRAAVRIGEQEALLAALLKQREA